VREAGVARKGEEIVAGVRRQIIAGELRPDDPVPSAKDIMRDWDVSISVAYSALTMMRQEGLAEKTNGFLGMVVTPRAAAIAKAWQPPPAPGALFRARIVRTAIELADAGGLAAMPMRSVAERLGVVVMTLYKYVRDRAELEILMADAVFAEHPPPETATGDWRAQLELLCRMQWQMYRRHTWLARTVTFKKPMLSPHAVGHITWAAGVMAHTGLARESQPQVAATAASFVRGNAMNLGSPARAPEDAEPDELFEFGLQRLLDGFARLLP
jgi:AcrR family transcriptional regulator